MAAIDDLTLLDLAIDEVTIASWESGDERAGGSYGPPQPFDAVVTSQHRLIETDEEESKLSTYLVVIHEYIDWVKPGDRIDLPNGEQRQAITVTRRQDRVGIHLPHTSIEV